MEWKSQPHPIERLASGVAGLSLGGASAFALAELAPLAGFALTSTAGAGGVAAAFGGLMLLGRIGEARAAGLGEISLIDFCESVDAPSAEHPDELLLDDPIIPIDPESRVVRLFDRVQPPEPLPEPGELAERIATYLDKGRSAAPSTAETPPARVDASVALHAALADIRRSLG